MCLMAPAKRSPQLRMRRDPNMQDREYEYEGLIRFAFETDKECVTGRMNRHQANALSVLAELR